MRPLRSNAYKGAPKQLAIEAEDTSGVLKHEIEYMFYARVASPETLLNAMCVEMQEQWGLWQDKTEKNAGSGSNRVRKVITKQIIHGQFDNINTVEQIVQTTKLKRSDGTSLEVSLESSEHQLAAFRVMAESGMVKHRYRFPIPDTDLVWEVDMFIEPGNSIYSTKYVGWAKIDLEVPDKNFPVPNLPDGFLDAFDSKIPNPTSVQKEVIDLMANYISLPNPYVEQIYSDLPPK